MLSGVGWWNCHIGTYQNHANFTNMDLPKLIDTLKEFGDLDSPNHQIFGDKSAITDMSTQQMWSSKIYYRGLPKQQISSIYYSASDGMNG